MGERVLRKAWKVDPNGEDTWEYICFAKTSGRAKSLCQIRYREAGMILNFTKIRARRSRDYDFSVPKIKGGK